MLALLALVQAAELPARPEAAQARPSDCERVMVYDSVNPPECKAVMVPPTDYGHLLQLEAWGDQVAGRCRIDAAVAEFEVEYLTTELEQERMARQAAEHVRWINRPGVRFGLGLTVGLAAGSGSVIGGAWALGQVGG
jgi:hypothetical protein